MTRKMKDSGIEWIGEIPEEWERRKLKVLGRVKGRIGFKGYTTNDIVDEEMSGRAIVLGGTNIMREGYISYEKLTYLSEEKYLESPEIMLYGGEILITKVGAGTGENAIYKNIGERVTINPNVMIYIPNDKENSFFINYCLLSDSIKKDIYLESNKSGAQPAINQDYVKNINIIYPAQKEQAKIVKYLDIKCAKIDKTIGKQKQLIEKLKEYKKSIITEAVTRGLNPNVKMKDSGVEWIGEVPVHWKVCKLKYLTRMKSGNSILADEIKENGTYPVFGGNGLRGYTESYTNEGVYILIGRQGALCGNVRIVNGRFWATEHAIVLYELIDLSKIWFANNLYAMNLNQYSTSAAQPGLSIEQIQKLYICVPPIDEQQEVADYLDKKCTAIDKSISQKEKLIEKLTEYKKSLIYECVTGKREV